MTPDARAAGERGAALIEFSIVVTLLLLLVFGIVTYGVILSYRQVLTQSAADGARAGSIAVDDPGTVGDERVVAAREALDESLVAYDRSCSALGDEGLMCTVDIGECPNDPQAECVTITLDHDYANEPLVPAVGPMAGLTPDHVRVTSVAIVGESP